MMVIQYLFVWDPALAKPFVNAEPPAAISAEACGLQCEAKPLNQIFDRCRASQGAFDRDCDEFLRKCVTFSLKPSPSRRMRPRT